jgi:hypothetical protein
VKRSDKDFGLLIALQLEIQQYLDDHPATGDARDSLAQLVKDGYVWSENGLYWTTDSGLIRATYLLMEQGRKK